MDLTIFIPTMNRPGFVGRLLAFLSAAGYDGVISLGDSSSGEHLDAMEVLVERFKTKLALVYRYFPPSEYPNDSCCMAEMLRDATTTYGVYCGDDDLVMPRALRRCIDFLSTHPEYSAAHGYRVEFMLDGAKPHGDIKLVRFAEELLLEDDGPYARWKAYMRYPISTQYYVHRITTWQKMYQHVRSTPLRYVGPELLPCSISVLSGKIAEIDEISTLFQIHDDHVFSWHNSSLYQLMRHPDWHASVSVFREEVCRLLLELSGESRDEAEQFVDRELWCHIKNFLTWQFFFKYPEENKGIRKLLEKFHQVLLPLRSLMRTKSNHMVSTGLTFDALLKHGGTTGEVVDALNVIRNRSIIGDRL